MTLRPPQRSSRPTQVVALDYEIAQEQASALGRLGRALEAALTALSAHEAAHPERDSERARMVQREACGLRDPRPALRDYRVPSEVHARMGIFRRR
ncbi:MAG: DUF6665 family protein [Xanthobacteraceae bacterium]